MDPFFQQLLETGGLGVVCVLLYLLHKNSIKEFREDLAKERESSRVESAKEREAFRTERALERKEFREDLTNERKEFRDELAEERDDCSHRHQEIMAGLQQHRHDLKDMAQSLASANALTRAVIKKALLDKGFKPEPPPSSDEHEGE